MNIIDQRHFLYRRIWFLRYYVKPIFDTITCIQQIDKEEDKDKDEDKDEDKDKKPESKSKADDKLEPKPQKPKEGQKENARILADEEEDDVKLKLPKFDEEKF